MSCVSCPTAYAVLDRIELAKEVLEDHLSQVHLSTPWTLSRIGSVDFSSSSSVAHLSLPENIRCYTKPRLIASFVSGMLIQLIQA
jgi:hypothetical protein